MEDNRIPRPIVEVKKEKPDVIIDLEETVQTPAEIANDFHCLAIKQIKKHLLSSDSISFFECMKWYRAELNKFPIALAGEFLKEPMVRHLKSFRDIFRSSEFNLQTYEYLNIMEDLLTFYSNLVMKDLANKKDILSSKVLKTASARESRTLKTLLAQCLLEKSDRMSHVLLRMDSFPDIQPCRNVLNNLFGHYLSKLHHEPNTFNYIRCYIICQKWKQNRKPADWPVMKKFVQDIFKKNPDAIQRNYILKNIILEVQPKLAKENQNQAEMTRYLFEKVKLMSEEYFKVMKNMDEAETMVIKEDPDKIDTFLIWDDYKDSGEIFDKWLQSLEKCIDETTNVPTINDDTPDIVVVKPEVSSKTTIVPLESNCLEKSTVIPQQDSTVVIDDDGCETNVSEVKKRPDDINDVQVVDIESKVDIVDLDPPQQKIIVEKPVEKVVEKPVRVKKNTFSQETRSIIDTLGALKLGESNISNNDKLGVDKSVKTNGLCVKVSTVDSVTSNNIVTVNAINNINSTSEDINNINFVRRLSSSMEPQVSSTSTEQNNVNSNDEDDDFNDSGDTGLIIDEDSETSETVEEKTTVDHRNNGKIVEKGVQSSYNSRVNGSGNVNGIIDYELEFDKLLSGPVQKVTQVMVNPDKSFDLYGNEKSKPDEIGINSNKKLRNISPQLFQNSHEIQSPEYERFTNLHREEIFKKMKRTTNKIKLDNRQMEIVVKSINDKSSRNGTTKRKKTVEIDLAPKPHMEKPRQRLTINSVPQYPLKIHTPETKMAQPLKSIQRTTPQIFLDNTINQPAKFEIIRSDYGKGNFAPNGIHVKGMSDPNVYPVNIINGGDDCALNLKIPQNISEISSFIPTFVENNAEKQLLNGIGTTDCKYDSCKSLLENFDEFNRNEGPEIISRVPESTVVQNLSNVEFEEVETRLPLKKRKTVARDSNGKEGLDTIEEFFDKVIHKVVEKKEISYPAETMISIAEVQERGEKLPRFKTAAERKEIPRIPQIQVPQIPQIQPPQIPRIPQIPQVPQIPQLPHVPQVPPPVELKNIPEPPRIVTEQYNNHTYNNPTINYHMNTPFPQPIIANCAYVPNFCVSFVPVGGTAAFVGDAQRAKKTPAETTEESEEVPPKRRRGRPKKE